MKKLFGLFFLSVVFITSATERFETDQNYYRTYYKNYGTGKGVIVAVVDEGVWQSHPDLKGSEWVNKKEINNNGVDDDKNGYIDDYFGWNFLDNNSNMTPKGNHATAVAGVIAGQINNEGIAGIAPEAKIMSLIVCTDEGCPFDSVKKAIYYAVDNGANVVNLSLGGKGYVGYNKEYDDVIKYAYNKGVLVVASAGNGDPNAPGIYGQDLSQIPVSPVCNDPDGINMVLGVGATKRANNNKTLWSNFGSCVDTWAQGESVVSTSVPLYSDNYFYSSLNDGTSFSAPIISGIAAILKSSYKELQPLDLIDIFSTSFDPYDLNELTKLRDSRQCRIFGISVEINNGESFRIKGEHFHSNSSFSLFRFNQNNSQDEIRIDSGVKILDSKNALIDTSKVKLESGVYSIGGSSGSCKADYGSVVIKGSFSGSNNSPSAVNLNYLNKDFSDADFLANKNIIKKQVTSSDYRLDAKVLRQEVIAMAVKISGIILPDDYVCNKKFSDISQSKPNNWVCRSVEIAAENNIISTKNSKFRPEDNITRAEALSILMKAAHIDIQEFNGISKYEDVTLAWQINVANTALVNGFIDGTDNFYPNNQALRGDIFNMAHRIMEKSN